MSFSDYCCALLESVFPFSCHICAARSGWNKVLCPACLQRLREEIHCPHTVTGLIDKVEIVWFGLYENTLATTIKTGKYRPSRKTVQQLAAEICNVAQTLRPDARPDIFIPVPLHHKREQQRGFNQAEIHARTWAAGLRLEISPVLQRHRATQPQAECNETNRATNLSGAFSLAPGLRESAFRGRHLCLVDDVATTGATLKECATVLAGLNPGKISAWVCAHSPRRTPRNSGAKTKSFIEDDGVPNTHCLCNQW